MDEDWAMDQHEINQAVATYGTAVVKIWRCVNVGTARTLTTIIQNFPSDVFRGSRVSSAAVVEDAHVSHAVQHIMMGPEFGLGPRTKTVHQREVARMWGDEGQVMTFMVRGRSRAALQGLGIIADDITTTGDTPVKEEQGPEREATLGVMKVENDVVSIVDSEDEVEVPARRIKQEDETRAAEDNVIGIDDDEDDEKIKVDVGRRRIKLEQQDDNADQQENLGADERTQKRKALEDELEQVEEEERLLELRQRKRRLRRDLALLEDERSLL